MSRTIALKASYVDTSIGEQIVKTGNYTAVLEVWRYRWTSQGAHIVWNLYSSTGGVALSLDVTR